MTKKKPTSEPIEVKPVEQLYTLPELNVAVKATSVEDAVAKAKKVKEN